MVIAGRRLFTNSYGRISVAWWSAVSGARKRLVAASVDLVPLEPLRASRTRARRPGEVFEEVVYEH